MHACVGQTSAPNDRWRKFQRSFFSDVRIPDSHRLGEVNQGWSVALTTLMNERASIAQAAAAVAVATQSYAMLRHFGLDNDSLSRQQLMNIFTYGKVLGG